MTEHHKHIEPSAELIRLYHEGKLDDRTMHALERQALDDPFLAEALDGFAAAPQAAADEHLQDLHNRLANRVAPAQKVRYLNYRWAAAATVLVLVSTGALFYFNSKQRATPLAQQKSVPAQKDTPAAAVATHEPAAEVAAVERPDLPSPLGSGREVQSAPVADNNARAMDSSALALSEVLAQKKKEETEKAALRFTRKTDTTYFNEPAAPPVMRSYEIQKDSPIYGATFNKQMSDSVNRNFIVIRGVAGKAAGVDVNRQGWAARSRLVEGRITDEDHNPLTGVTVMDKARRNGTVTDEKGYFHIMVDSNKTSNLSFNYIGFEQKSLKLGAKDNNLAIVMQPSTSALQDVVVVGYGSQKRKKAEGISAKEQNSNTYPAGGFDAFRQYLYDSTRYTEQMQAAGVKGSVIVAFVVEKDGRLSQFRIVKKLNNAADQEAIRVIKEGPQWIPSDKKKARKVNVEVFFPRQEGK